MGVCFTITGGITVLLILILMIFVLFIALIKTNQRKTTMITLLDKECPKKCAGCFAMRCQKCIIMDSKSVFEYLVKDAEKKKPEWCPCHELSKNLEDTNNDI